jgi:hypothetical protein
MFDNDTFNQRYDDDAAILTLFREWREAVRLCNESEADDGDGLDEKAWAIERQIYDTPASSAVSLAIKASMFVQGETSAFDEDDFTYASDGTLQLDQHALKGLAEDVARVLAELAPLTV